MPLRRNRFTIALVLWTFLVWTTRIANIWNDDSLTDGAKWGRTVLALSFTLLALGVALALYRRADWRDLALKALAGWTVGVWLVRSAGIVRDDHEAPFVVVHLILAVVSITLAVLAMRETAQVPPPEPVAPIELP